MSIKYPKTVYEYVVEPVEGKDTYRVIRQKYTLLSNMPKDKLLIKSSTMLNRVGKNIAEDFVFKKERNIPII